MNAKHPSPRWLVPATALLVVACLDEPAPTAPSDTASAAQSAVEAPRARQDLAAWFARSAPEVLALPRTVFAGQDEGAGRLVFGVEDEAAARGARDVLGALGVPASSYRIEVTEPIQFMNGTLRQRHRPTVGGLQIHWSNYLCTLGFNVDHGGGRSFITNSHCTNNQGQTGSTAYYQPTSSVDSSPIAIEADDPAYFQGGPCPRGRKCRYSDASRALYQSGTESTRGVIAKTTGVNNGNLDVVGSLTVASQENTNTSFSGSIDKVGRTTGWTRGNVTNTCATVNVSGSNITLLCQTLVQQSGTQIVGGGDSGSPVFTAVSGDNVALVGVLWGGSSSGDLFVFSPLKNIQDELGGMTATSSGDGGGGGNGGGGGDGDDGGGGGNCPPNSNAPRCR